MNNNINTEVLEFFKNILNNGKEHSGGEYSFKCPQKDHRHSRLYVNFKTGNYQCWACDNLQGRNFITLLKKIGGNDYQLKKLIKILDKNNTNINKDINNITELKEVIEDKFNTNTKQNKNNINLSLPNNFKSLHKNHNTIEYKNAYKYVKNRGITDRLISKYNIGYCEDGRYKNRIIIPSYNKKGKLNYFTARKYYKDSKALKYKNPSVTNKDIIPFELYISFNIPINITEGMFDAISMDYNSIPLLGKNVSDKLIYLLNIHDTSVNLIFDGDAQNSIYNVIEKFIQNDIKIKNVKLPNNKDPNEMDNNKLFRLIKETNYMNYSELLKLKLKSKK